MASATSELDEQIERLRKGDTLAENEVKALCEKVSKAMYPTVQAGETLDIGRKIRAKVSEEHATFAIEFMVLPGCSKLHWCKSSPWC